MHTTGTTGFYTVNYLFLMWKFYEKGRKRKFKLNEVKDFSNSKFLNSAKL